MHSSDDSTPTRSRWEVRFAALLDAAVDGIVVIDERGTIELVNAATRQLFDYSDAELVGRNVSMLMPEPHASGHDGYLARYLRTGEARIIGIGREVQGLRRDGTLFPMRLAVGEAHHEGGRSFVGFIRDRTVRIELEHSLHRRDEELRGILESGAVATALTDGSGRFLRVNLACCRLYRRSTEELLVTDALSLCVPGDRDLLAAQFSALSAGALGSTALEHRVVRSDGEERQVVTHAAKLEDDEDEKRFVLQTVDHTERRIAEQRERESLSRLAHANRLGTLGEMAAGIAHELNQPLGAIVNYAQAAHNLLGRDEIDRPRLSGLCQRIAEQAERAGAVIRRLRTLTRGELADLRRLDLRDVLIDAVRLTETEARLEGLRVELEVPEEEAPSYVDPVQIQQVLINLVHNAIDAMREQTARSQRRVAIRLDRDGCDWRIAVRDHGSGIADSHRERLLTPFFTTKDNGTGLGLVICQSILRAHGGRLEFANVEAGRGAVFTFRLPVEDKSASRAAAPGGTTTP
jgi:two-component system sensor kinase FixL